MKRISYVCFDIGGVLGGPPNTIAALQIGQERWGAVFSRNLLRSLIHAEIADRDYWRDFQNGTISVQE